MEEGCSAGSGTAASTGTGPMIGVFVHERALCESSTVGEGSRVWAFAHVMAGARVGRHCNIGDHAFIESGAVLGDRVVVKNGVQIWSGVVIDDEVFLGPSMVFTNVLTPRVGFKKREEEFIPTRVCRGATIGANATIVCGVTIHERAFVGAGAVVTRDVPAYGMVVGNPARRIGWACECGARLPGDLGCACGRSFELTESGLRPVPACPNGGDGPR